MRLFSGVTNGREEADVAAAEEGDNLPEVTGMVVEGSDPVREPGKHEHQ
mgnify:CR=1 FL=1